MYTIKFDATTDEFLVEGCLNDDALGVDNRRAHRQTLRGVMELIGADLQKIGDTNATHAKRTQEAGRL